MVLPQPTNTCGHHRVLKGSAPNDSASQKQNPGSKISKSATRVKGRHRQHAQECIPGKSGHALSRAGRKIIPNMRLKEEHEPARHRASATGTHRISRTGNLQIRPLVDTSSIPSPSVVWRLHVGRVRTVPGVIGIKAKPSRALQLKRGVSGKPPRLPHAQSRDPTGRPGSRRVLVAAATPPQLKQEAVVLQIGRSGRRVKPSLKAREDAEGSHSAREAAEAGTKSRPSTAVLTIRFSQKVQTAAPGTSRFGRQTRPSIKREADTEAMLGSPSKRMMGESGVDKARVAVGDPVQQRGGTLAAAGRFGRMVKPTLKASLLAGLSADAPKARNRQVGMQPVSGAGKAAIVVKQEPEHEALGTAKMSDKEGSAQRHPSIRLKLRRSLFGPPHCPPKVPAKTSDEHSKRRSMRTRPSERMASPVPIQQPAMSRLGRILKLRFADLAQRVPLLRKPASSGRHATPREARTPVKVTWQHSVVQLGADDASKEEATPGGQKDAFMEEAAPGGQKDASKEEAAPGGQGDAVAVDGLIGQPRPRASWRDRKERRERSLEAAKPRRSLFRSCRAAVSLARQLLMQEEDVKVVDSCLRKCMHTQNLPLAGVVMSASASAWLMSHGLKP